MRCKSSRAHLGTFLLLILVIKCAASRKWMRPSPSHDLPVMGLIESADKRYDPKPEDLNGKMLREKMGQDFDRQFMSESRPVESILHPNGTVEFSFKRTKRGRVVPASKMPKEIRHLRLHSLKLPDGSRVRMKVGKKMRRKFKELLWAYTYCPVAFRWKDLGLRFWPRWIREGSCLTLGSCSFPSGMSCKPHKFVGKMVLRWHCQDWSKKKLCSSCHPFRVMGLFRELANLVYSDGRSLRSSSGQFPRSLIVPDLAHHCLYIRTLIQMMDHEG